MTGLAPEPGEPLSRMHDARVLMYSHDTFGLGHLRRCRTIAHALVEHFKGLNVLILSGSQIAGAFDFRARVDFVKIPSVIKLYNGEYTSIGRHIDLDETLALRKSLILETARSFEPDLLIVDKEPLGLKGELEPTLDFLKTRGCHLVLGLREVMDSHALLKAEWDKADIVRKMEAIYHHIWIYGSEDFHDPLQGFDLSEALRRRLTYTGFLRRERSTQMHYALEPAMPAGAILVTAGGGGDGGDLMRQFIAAHHADKALTRKAHLVLGPFMHSDEREAIKALAAPLPHLTVIDFDTHLEALVEEAEAIVSMGGYNTFCEILSFNKRALIVPRTSPREEQLIRAMRAHALGFVDMLHPAEAANPHRFAQALHRLEARALPHDFGAEAILNGLPVICQNVGTYLAAKLMASSESGVSLRQETLSAPSPAFLPLGADV